jgi:PAS domain S-box-containing protein
LSNNDVFFSPRYKELLGYRDDEFPNVLDSFQSHVHPSDLPKVMEAVQAHLDERLPYEAEFRMRHKNGEWSWFSARGQAMWDKDGKPYRMAGSQRDITDRKQAEQNVNEFFSTVSHELRTPLSAVKGSLRLIEGGLAGQISNEARELLDIALSSCERLIRLVNDILDLRKIEAGKIDLHLKKVNAGQLVQEVLQGLTSYAENHGVTLTYDVPESLKLEADHDRIVQVMTNLVGNAVKFSGNGANVKVQAEKSDESHIRFSVKDTGPGIPKDKQHLLFMKFKQLDASDSRRQDGTGLGLAICKAIVGQHHGKIGVESEEGQGTTFWFELPINAGTNRGIT